MSSGSRNKMAKVRKRVNRFDEFEKDLLERKFKANKTPSSEACQEIANLINDNRKSKNTTEKNGAMFVLTGKQIKFWFDHRRRIQNHGTYKPLKPGSRSSKKASTPKRSTKTVKAEQKSGAKQVAGNLKEESKRQQPAKGQQASARQPAAEDQGVASTSGSKSTTGPEMTSLPSWMHSFQLLPLMSTMKYATYPPGTVIIKNGELSDDLYFLLKGSVKVIDVNNNEVAELKEGSFFGEMGVIDKGPRTATVVAEDHCHAFIMSGEVARDMLECEPVVSKDVVDQATSRLLDLLKAYETSPASKLVGANILKFNVYKKGQIILKEGEYTDDFYFLSKGSVVVTKQGNYISKLNEGTFFGEMAALCSGARTTTVTSAEDCEVFLLPGEILRMLSKDDKDLKNGIGETLRNVVFARAYDTMMALTDNSIRPTTADIAVSTMTMSADLKLALFQLLKCIHNVTVNI
ncbi:cyclic nucleotide-binding domain-containing protein [Chloropicon primus]|uniref:Cyclic nucleotide-binding domain-containing protein n=1 Tax=Chloropicon primus TaxID=1764295 RepID=A0A5B8ME69_9CHLO|nr:cyclic nucleotide-binding domain-containing protein [Chloropicon primus]UPQ97930.1 cyclic nucleotide-binding domain-containing protein [Chloropicon primus]|mmetsp:Transcript_12221/g.33922  ORF Transcript_12221/g.33922 Transcript_12221/m.33922 type:complete len:462 (-) Transcript_12221:95-1480(-)|eukprot:QDZ18723.1 cyclic nucleotide-binding domain-containing protein [Chloropicon primus]